MARGRCFCGRPRRTNKALFTSSMKIYTNEYLLKPQQNSIGQAGGRTFRLTATNVVDRLVSSLLKTKRTQTNKRMVLADLNLLLVHTVINWGN